VAAASRRRRKADAGNRCGPAGRLILKNANVITIDARSSVAEAIAIAGDKILAVGPGRRRWRRTRRRPPACSTARSAPSCRA
jgi:hypothetical protein